MTDSIGFLAGALTTLSFVPQVFRAWRTRSTGDLSLTMLLVFSAGVALWLGYGIALASLPMIVTNASTLALTIVLIVLKVRGSR